jgi:flavin reductase (DIM6/NTAB) family NADH-FMN oxidoreductase RutF
MSREKEITKVLAKLEYGIYVVTMGKGQDGNALTVSWLTQVASEPPTVVVSIKNSHQSARLLKEMDAFAVNILPQGEDSVAKAFYGPAESGYHKLQGTTVKAAPTTGSPIIPGAVGFLDCRIVKRVPVGNHTVFIGEVLAAELEKDVTVMSSTNSKLRYAG